MGRRTILFVDEIHRFNKAQQDAFLPRVEAGDIVLIGATTENPSFEVNRRAALALDRCSCSQPLAEEDVAQHSRARAGGQRCAASGARPSTSRTTRSARSRASQRRRADRAEPARGRRTRRARRTQCRAPPGRHRLRGAGGPAPHAALRQGRRGALQPHLGAAQVDAQQRPRRRDLLAGADGRGGRGPAVHRAAPGALRVRGRRHRRPAGAGGRHGGEGRGALHRHARRQHGAGAGGDLSGDRAEEQRGLRRLPAGRRGRAEATWPSRCRCICATRRRG